MRTTRLAISAALIALSVAVAAQQATPAGAAWPGRNGPILVRGGDADSSSGIWAKQLGRGGIRRVTTNSGDAMVETSPNGRLIAFARPDPETIPEGGILPAVHIYVARADGSGVRRVTDGPSYDFSPTFSPSGRRVLFSRAPAGGDSDIFGVRIDGSGLHQITSGGDDDRYPAFSPNGRLIAFARNRGGEEPTHVFTMRPNGSGLNDATPGMSHATHPTFNPRGNRIAFVRGAAGAPRTDIWQMRPDGAKRSRVTGTRGRKLGGYSNPAYSPNGRLLAATFEVDGQFDKVHVIRLRNRSLVTVLGGRRYGRAPEMSDPAWIALPRR